MTKQPTPTATHARYIESITNLVAQKLGFTIGADGVAQQLPNTSMELVIVHEIYPDSMEAFVTYRDSTVDNGQKDDTRKVMILSPFVGDNCKLLILPPGEDSKDPVTGANIRTPTQKDLTGLCLNLNGNASNGSVLLGYVRMTDEGPVAVESDVFLSYGDSLFKITADGIELDNGESILKIANDTIEMDNGTSSVKITSDTVEIDSTNIILNGIVSVNSKIIGN